jgi:uroporphyrinogen decarboxylase
MTSLERVRTTLGHREPDRILLFLLLTMHGAQELDLSIETSFSRPEYVIESQLRLRRKYRNACFYAFFYASVETKAWGGDVLDTDDGPLNAGRPIIRTPEQAEAQLKAVIAAAGPGGGFILSDNHGEIPCQVPEDTLLAISEAVHRLGTYPLDPSLERPSAPPPKGSRS